MATIPPVCKWAFALLILPLWVACAENKADPLPSEIQKGASGPNRDGGQVTSACKQSCFAGWFCDRGKCAEISHDFAMSPYGVECQPPLHLPPDDFGGGRVIDSCRGIYLCVEGRCSSCDSDSECTRSAVCTGVQGRFVGKRCLLPSDASIPLAPPP